MTHAPADGETSRCIKCGTEVRADETMCAACNRAGMATPSATQYHGTIAVAIVLAVAALAWLAGAALEGVGPFRAEVRSVTAADSGYAVTYAVTNDGTKTGRAKCQVLALDERGRRLRAANALSPRVGDGETVETSVDLADLDEEPTSVEVSCS